MSESACRTVVVGTDGSLSSPRAVTRAGVLAGACDPTLVVACAYLPKEPDDREVAAAQGALRGDAYQVVGSHPAEDTGRTAARRASRAGATGLAGIRGRLPGSVPADATRRSAVDVLVVHTTG